MSAAEQVALLTEAKAALAAQIEAFHDNGYVFVAFCGDWGKPAVLARSFEDMPTYEELEDLGQRKGYAVLAFSRGGQIDDMSPVAPSNRRPRSLVRDWQPISMT